ncbi:MAG: response regulator [Chthoniobacterales bacterium]
MAVEDNPLHLKLVHVVLSAAGHRVSGARGASQAIESINRDKPEIIIVDLSLPDSDGLSLVRLLRSDPHSGKIPVLAVTFYPERYTREDAMAAGCDAYVVKPISTRTLPDLVTQIAAGR